jgi:hypothetical protein
VYGVKHPRWQVYPVRRCDVDANFGELYGSLMAGIDPKQPAHVLLAEGSEISVEGGERLD